MMIDELNIVVQKSRDGRDYVQIMSEDMVSVNVVLIAGQITVQDTREPTPPAEELKQ